MSDQLSGEQALAAILAGCVVRVVTGPDPEDPVCLHYLDRCDEFYSAPMIYTESVGGWSEGGKEAICDPDSDFYVEFVSDRLSIEIVDQKPPQREHSQPVIYVRGNAR